MKWLIKNNKMKNKKENKNNKKSKIEASIGFEKNGWRYTKSPIIRIKEIIKENGKISATALSRKSGVHYDDVKKKIKLLEDKGLIEVYNVEIPKLDGRILNFITIKNKNIK